MTTRMTRGAFAAALLAGLLAAAPAAGGGRYSGESGGAALPPSLGNSFTGRYAGAYRFTEKSFFRNSENNRSHFRNGFARRSLFGQRVERESRLKQRYAAEAAVPRALPALPDLEIFQPAERPPRLGGAPAADPPLDAATRREIADKLLKRSAP